MMAEDDEEESLEELSSRVETMSEDIGEKFEQKIEELEKEEEEEDDRISQLERDFEDLKKEVSDARKQDKAVFAAHNKLLSFPSQLKLAKAMGSEEEFEKAEKILKQAEEELKEAGEKEVDVRSEVEKRFQEKKEEETVNLDEKVDDSDNAFHLANGETVESLRDLVEALPEMSDENFDLHIRNGNDFAHWIRIIFQKRELANEITNMDDKERMAEAIKEAAGGE